MLFGAQRKSRDGLGGTPVRLTAGRFRDALIIALLAILCFFFYAHFGLRLAQGIYSDYLNLAFDFDPATFVADLAGQPGAGLHYKHPLILLFRPFAAPFLALGFAPRESAALVMALFGGLTVALVYLFTRLVQGGRPEALGAAMLFAVSATPLFAFVIVESYGLALFSIVLVWIIFMAGTRVSPVALKRRYVAALLVAGVTITNVMHALVAEFFTWRPVLGVRHAAVRTVLFGVTVGAALLVMLVMLQPGDLGRALGQPVQTAKEVYWLKANSGSASLADLLRTYAGYGFLAPDFTRVALSDAVVMIDFRAFSYTRAETLVLFPWWGFGLVGLLAGLRDQGFRRVAVPLLLMVMLNLLLHLNYQFRGSLYLYSAHLYFPIFALGLGAAPWVSRQTWRWRMAYLGALSILILGAAMTNVTRVADFVGRFDHLGFPAEAVEIAPQGR